MIFDTDVLIWFLRGDSSAARLIESQAERAVSIISQMELLQGVRSREEVRVIHDLYRQSGIRIIPADESICHLALSLIEAHALTDGLRAADALVAATARKTGLPLATGNVRHFRAIPGLEVKAFRPRTR
jgi:predicted nucleic acid-binding protein